MLGDLLLKIERDASLRHSCKEFPRIKTVGGDHTALQLAQDTHPGAYYSWQSYIDHGRAESFEEQALPFVVGTISETVGDIVICFAALE